MIHKHFYKLVSRSTHILEFECGECLAVQIRTRSEFWGRGNKHGILVTPATKSLSRWAKIKDALLGGGYFSGQW